MPEAIEKKRNSKSSVKKNQDVKSDDGDHDCDDDDDDSETRQSP